MNNRRTRNEVVQSIARRKRVLEEDLKVRQQQVDDAPDGRLEISARKKQAEYYRMTSTTREYLSRRKQHSLYVAQALAQKNYDQKVIQAEIAELNLLEEVEGKYEHLFPAEQLYGNCSPERQALIQPIELPDETFLQWWSSEEYEGAPWPKETQEYQTMKGEVVRSRIELIICDRLAYANLHYKYEHPLTLVMRKEFGQGRKAIPWVQPDIQVNYSPVFDHSRYWAKTIYPDMTILLENERTEVYWEHFGLLDDDTYFKEFQRKMDWYSQSGLIEQGRLIVTFEKSSCPPDIKDIQNKVDSLVERSHG